MAINWPAVSFTILPNIGGWVNGFNTKDDVKVWYQTLKKPALCPPDWVFGPVWTGIYSSIGYASYMVYRDGGGCKGDAKLPLMVYGSNLALNWAWSQIFFKAHNLKWGFYEINLINATAAATGYLFYKINPHAGLMFLPYVMWVSFATYLTWGLYKKNSVEITEVKDK